MKPVLVSADKVEKSIGARVMDKHGNRVRIVAKPENHIVMLGKQPLLYTESHARRVWRLAKIPEGMIDACIACIKTLAADADHAKEAGSELEIVQMNGKPAAQCGLAEAFLRNGFVTSGDKLVLTH